MKTFLYLIASVFGLLFSSMQAQIITGGIPIVHETATRLSSSLDVNGDGRTDVIELNKAQGSVTLGIRQVDGSFIWSAPRAIGYTDVETMSIGKFSDPSEYSVATTSRQFNSIQLMPLDGSELPAPMGLNLPPEPQALATVHTSSGVQGMAIGYAHPSLFVTAATPLHFQRVNTFGGWSNYEIGKNPRFGSTLYTHPAQLPTLGFVTDSEDGANARLQLFAADENSGYSVTEWASLPVDIRYVQGFFTADSTSHSLGHRSTTIVAWQPGQATLRIARLTDYDAPNDLLLGNLQIPASSFRSYGMQRPIHRVYVLYKTGGSHRLLITWADAAGGASIHSFDGETVPDLIEGVSLNGLELDAMVPLAGGDFVALGSRNGSPVHDVFSETVPGHYSPIHTSTFPSVPNKVFYSNVVAFQGEPMVDENVQALKQTRVADWTIQALPSGPTASITGLVDMGTASGLSNLTNTDFAAPGQTTHFLLNQLSPNSSVAFVSAKTLPQANLPKMVFQPPPGLSAALQPGESFEIYLSDTTNSFDVFIRYSLNGGPWLYNLRNTPILITGNSTLRAYAASYLRGTGNITTASYSFGTVPPVSVPAITDTNINGLADSWEDLTGISNPAGDDDGDGFLNLAEHNAGFDANDATSKPDAVAQSPNLQIVQTASPATPHALRWDASDTAILLETSADLQSWTLVTHGTRVEGNDRVFDLPTNSFVRRFYRLRR